MGIYIYGISTKSIPSPIGPIHTSYFVGRNTFNPSKAINLSLARIDSRFGGHGPDFFVVGDPKTFVEEAKRKGEVIFAVHDNREHHDTSFLDDSNRRPVVGTLTVQADGQIVFKTRKDQFAWKDSDLVTLPPNPEV